MSYGSLREWMDAAESHGELKRISGADWNLEMSSIAEIMYREIKDFHPALLFDDIPGYPKGFRTLFGQFASPWNIAIILGLSEDQLDRTSLVRNWRRRSKNLRLIPPKLVKSGPVLTNTDTGGKVDLFKFPAPRFHELDSPNRYIGTACNVIQKDPDSGYVNVGAYRIMVVDHNRVTVHISGGNHGSIIMHQKYFAQGEVMPMAIAIGAAPVLNLAAGFTAPWGVSEYDYAGGVMNAPLETIEGPYTGLPVPANAEIVLEGDCRPGEEVDEGPFGEWHGYYGNLGLHTVPEPVMRVKMVHYRNDPILTCCQRTRPPQDDSLAMSVIHGARIWTSLEEFGIPGIQNVWCHEVGHGKLFNVIAIKQLYSGHARQVGTIASQYPIVGRYTIVVDEDIDPTNLDEVIWAMITRCDVARSIQILPYCRSSSQDTTIPVAEKMKYRVPPKPLYSARVIVDACQPFEHKAEWYPVTKVSTELRMKILEKWSSVFAEIGAKGSESKLGRELL